MPRGFIKPTIHPSRVLSVDWAYLAAMIDGEGSVAYVKAPNQNDFYTLAVYNSYEPLIDWIHRTFGGRKYTIHRITTNVCSNPKPQYRWIISSQKNVYLILLFIIPFLKVKHEVAEIALQHIYRRKLRTVVN